MRFRGKCVRCLAVLFPTWIGCGLAASDAIPQGRELYVQWCASCHGETHQGGLGGSLATDPFKQVGKDIGFVEYVKRGNLEMGMPAFADGLEDDQILSIAHYIAHVREHGIDAPVGLDAASDVGTGSHTFTVEDVFNVSGTPWSIAFFPDGSGGLVTRREGDVRLFRDGRLGGKVRGTPEAWERGQGGMMEVAVHPDYARNGWIYLAYAHQLGSSRTGTTRIVRGQLQGEAWVNEELIYAAPEDAYRGSGNHWGVRLVFRDGDLFFGIGDRGSMHDAQDLAIANGKIHRVHDDGRVPADNPFVDTPGALPTIWAYGVRNPQGLDLHPLTGAIWESEHGPRGGDEINVIESGKNYGWPKITYGINYNGQPISNRQRAPGMEQPKHYWTPSIAVCGIDFYEGELFPNWKFNLFAGGLSSEELHRLIVKDGKVVATEIILEGKGRIRDVASGPDGYLYLVLNGPSKVVRLVP